jgi:cytochrome b pre-mRNA-processing protein 3
MFRAFASLFSGPDYRQEAHQLYIRIVEQARQPMFYTDYAVPDTLDGRFDMIALHMFLISARLKKEDSQESLELLRAISEIFFADMDRSLREMGSTDTGVGKRIKKMSQAFYGRLLAYQTAGSDNAKMQEALLRNLYRGDIGKLANAHAMNGYVKTQRNTLSGQTLDQLMMGELTFSSSV